MKKTIEEQKTDAIMTAYEKLEYKDMREITEIADDLATRIKDKHARKKNYPFSRSMAIELLGKVGMAYVRMEKR